MRSKIYILFLLLCCTVQLFAQFTLRIEITNTPSAHKEEGVFVAGNFNNWNPADSQYQFFKEKDKLVVEIKNLPAKTYQFKFTRGNWQKVESTSKGIDVGNKEVQLSSDTTIQYAIAGWMDDNTILKKHTATVNVHILDTAFYIPQLKRTRRIWIYLPADYNATKKHYPVMYLQDGQNLFDEQTSAFGNEWGVDECLDSLPAKGKAGCIVVGIDNGGILRLSEYNFCEYVLEGGTSASQKLSPQGNEYLTFLSQTLKPFIDKKYRTLSSKENTIIAGSSLGGLIAYYAAIKYPDVFGKAGIFSPAFWIAPPIKLLTDSVTSKVNGKFFFYAGEKESARMVTDMNEVTQKLGTHSDAMIYTVIDPEGKHEEKAWRKWFAEFYVWMMADGFNYVIKLSD